MAISRMNMERQMRNMGGIMGLEEPRQGYFLGKIVKKAKRAVKKVTKSPLGKLALLGGLGAYGLGALGGKSFALKNAFNLMSENKLNELKSVISELREKCPWDKKQTFQSLRSLTIEEVYEKMGLS